MQRQLLGIITIAFLLVAAATHWITAWQGFQQVGDAFFRLGILLGVVWLALPNVLRLMEKLPAWLIGTTLMALAIMAVRPKTILLLGPLLVAIWVLAPQWFARKK